MLTFQRHTNLSLLHFRYHPTFSVDSRQVREQIHPTSASSHPRAIVRVLPEPYLTMPANLTPQNTISLDLRKDTITTIFGIKIQQTPFSHPLLAIFFTNSKTRFQSARLRNFRSHTRAHCFDPL